MACWIRPADHRLLTPLVKDLEYLFVILLLVMRSSILSRSHQVCYEVINLVTKHFCIFRNDTIGFNTKVTFCSYYLRDSIRLICNGGWDNYLQLYGGLSDSEETIKLYHYKVDGGSSTRLSVYDLNIGGYLTNNTEIPFVYLPGIQKYQCN